ncbi:hypothetical protein THRCLA_21761 [Thraustotheca clavata]|uniref:RRM domain-containing protein n=1 Tax=Thraustotheca clavata TaxID=74557 RepID=A0A1V9ZPX5_9STRA|nr:hypothetical protein THRCLA_21761 [Thraustotheca clavata]
MSQENELAAKDATPAIVDKEAEPDELCNVYVGHLTPHANETHLQPFFRPYGVIRHIWIARRPPGFAFVTYLKAQAAKRAVESINAMEDPSILGQTIKCELGNGEKSTNQPIKRKRVRTKKGESFKEKKARRLAVSKSI